MILTCPSCSARFLVPDTAIGDAGRRVRCGKCSYQWFCAGAPTGAPDIDTLMREGSVAVEAPKLRPLPPGSNLPAPPPQKAPWWMLAAAALALIAAAGLALAVFAPQFLGQPATAGLALANLHFEKTGVEEDGAARYTVSGDIVNSGEAEAKVPCVHITLLSGLSVAVKRWHYAPKGSNVAPDKPLHFIADDLAVPGDAADAQLRVELGSKLELALRKL